MTPGVQLATLCVLAAGVTAIGARVVIRKAQRNPEKRERRRRLLVNQRGRLGDALITEVTETSLYYTYTVRGVQYEASQDIAALRDRLPPEPERLIGVASLKYAPQNPANSILICEEWSGLRSIH
jgi:hypothetical protein